MKTIKLTVAQATMKFLKNQYSERDGIEQAFFAGCFGIFGHGNLAGFGQALQQSPDFRYYLVRNEQAAVHTAAGFAKMKNRLSMEMELLQEILLLLKMQFLRTL